MKVTQLSYIAPFMLNSNQISQTPKHLTVYFFVKEIYVDLDINN